VIAEELEDGAGRLQLGLIDVEIDSVEGFQFEDHVILENLSNRARPTQSRLALGDIGGDVL
jgi:hypothetical protein